LRYLGSDAPAAQVVAGAQNRPNLPVVFGRAGAPETRIEPAPALETARRSGPEPTDYTLIDPSLAVAPAAELDRVTPAEATPAPGLAYSGFTAVQRAVYHIWLEHPTAPAPPAFQQLLLANAEVRLLEGPPKSDAAYAVLRPLVSEPAWQGNQGLARTLLLACWLRGDGKGLAEWSACALHPAQHPALHPALWSVLLGCQALLGAPLHEDQLPPLAAAWGLPVPTVSAAVLRLRLDSLQTVLGQEPLAYALAKLDDGAKGPRPWRPQHRDLRFAFPQPDVRPHLQPLLADILAIPDELPAPAAMEQAPAVEPAAPQAAKRGRKSVDEAVSPQEDLQKAHLIVEFGASRSDVFGYVLRQAQKQGGFQQIMDENRHIVYRVPFRRSEMRRFWHLWTYIQGWNSTRVYCEGKELEKWQIYPYSQYLR
jgi:hypothetical protein